MPDGPWTADLDRLQGDLEQKIEATRVDLREEIAATRVDLREEIARSAAETRRHFDVVVEHFTSKLQLVAEGVAMVDDKVDRLRGDMEQRFDQVERRLLRLS
ncbi:MAG TPA: hypothetical protein VIG07_12915 [Methylomirabilota bacterium]|jgi:hypothetical protein